jgi:hypothetical protein
VWLLPLLLIPLLRVLGADPSSSHLATALIFVEQRKASEESAKAAWGRLWRSRIQ